MVNQISKVISGLVSRDSTKIGIPIIFISAIIVFLSVFIHLGAFDQGKSESGLDLRDDWKICIPDTAGVSGAERSCKETIVNILDVKHHLQYFQSRKAVEYRKLFQSPKFCTDSSITSCNLVLGGVYQGVEAILNGKSLGLHFTRADLYPAIFKIPNWLLKTDAAQNELTLVLKSQSSGGYPAVVQGPVGIFDMSQSDRISWGIVGERVALPLMSAVACLTLALISLFWMLSRNASPEILRHFTFYCLTAAAYMINATRIPREFLNQNTGLALNFALRYSMDFAIFGLVTSYYSIKSKNIKFLKYIFLALIGSFIIVGILSFFSSTFDTFLDFHRPDISKLTGLRQAGLIHILVCMGSPLWILGGVLGLYQSLKLVKFNQNERVLFILFAILVPMQIIDTLTFLGMLRTDHEIYYLRLYTPFIALSFGYVIWMKWIERERSLDAVFKAGEIASSVAHDLKVPLAVLRILSKSESGLDEDQEELLSGALNSIEKISSNLLLVYKSAMGHSLVRNPPEEFKPYSLIDLIEEIIKFRKFTLGTLSSELTFENHITDFEKARSGLQNSEFKRALNNIIGNAIDATRYETKPSVVVRLSRKNQYIVIEVVDNGPGINEHLMLRLNNHDFGKSTSLAGHGIGLAQTWGVIHLHKGDLRFKKNSQRGVTVQVIISAEV